MRSLERVLRLQGVLLQTGLLPCLLQVLKDCVSCQSILS